MNCSHNTAIVLTMRIVSHFLEKVKDEIHVITGLEPPACPNCGQIMEPHGRCRRYVRMPGGIRHTLSLRVFHCSKCRHYHRELPDFMTPRKHLCTEVIAAIYDNLDNYDVDNSTITRIRHWVKQFMKFGAATVNRLKLEHPTLVTKYNANHAFDTLKYFVKVVTNANEWKFISSPVMSG